jgi:hypothetical protein
MGTLKWAPQVDPDGVVRPQDGNHDCVATVDMGAYEFPASVSDCTPPVTTASASPAANSAGWNKSSVTVTLSAVDEPGGSGVQSIQYWLTGAQTSSVVTGGNPSSVTITAEGLTMVDFSALDKANNAEPVRSLPVRIDKTAPAISGMPAANCTLSPAKHQLITVANVTASDALSGVASMSVSAISNVPDSGTGGGDLPGDIVISGGTVQLRAERAPSGKGRVYTITATATDIAGNTATSKATCGVPK